MLIADAWHLLHVFMKNKSSLLIFSIIWFNFSIWSVRHRGLLFVIQSKLNLELLAIPTKWSVKAMIRSLSCCGATSACTLADDSFPLRDLLGFACRGAKRAEIERADIGSSSAQYA